MSLNVFTNACLLLRILTHLCSKEADARASGHDLWDGNF